MILSPHIGMIFDGLIMVLLLVTIFYSMRLSRLYKIFSRLQDDKKEIDILIKQLSKIIDTANDAIKNMKDAASKDGNSLQKHIDEARVLSDELEIIVTSGNNLASRLQRLAEQTRTGKNNDNSAHTDDDADGSEDEMDKLAEKAAATKSKTQSAKRNTAKNTPKSDKEKMILEAMGGRKGK